MKTHKRIDYKHMLPVKKPRTVFYSPQGFRAVTVKRPLKTAWFIVAALICVLIIPLKIMLEVRTDRSLAEWWTRNIQAGWERFAGTLTDWLPFSVLELFIVVGIALAVFLFVRLFINLCTARFKKILHGVLTLALGGVYILDLYVMSMGFGYYREAMPFPQAGERYTVEQAEEAIEYFLADFNALSKSLPRDKNKCIIRPYSFGELADRIKKEYAKLKDSYFASYTPSAKPVVNSWFLSDMLITGITFLPFGEATVNTEAPSTVTTITMAHELAHAKGIQREGDANLLARYVLLASDDGYLRYCGYYAAFYNLAEAYTLANEYDKYTDTLTRIDPDVYWERKFTYDYWNSQPDIIGKIAEFFNNLYLESNGASNGTGSYDDANQGDVVIPTDPETGEPQKDPETGEVVKIIVYSQVQRMFFWLYENRKGRG